MSRGQQLVTERFIEVTRLSQKSPQTCHRSTFSPGGANKPPPQKEKTYCGVLSPVLNW
jgi:hypothetical protein